ncbi:MAG: hypothetical protein ABII97_02555 [Patescibacteria group bacterium]
MPVDWKMRTKAQKILRKIIDDYMSKLPYSKYINRVCIEEDSQDIFIRIGLLEKLPEGVIIPKNIEGIKIVLVLEGEIKVE